MFGFIYNLCSFEVIPHNLAEKHLSSFQTRCHYLFETGDLLPRPMAPSNPEFSLSSPSCSRRLCSLRRPRTTPDPSVWPDCGCSCSAARFSALCHQRNSLASSPGPLDTRTKTNHSVFHIITHTFLDNCSVLHDKSVQTTQLHLTLTQTVIEN